MRYNSRKNILIGSIFLVTIFLLAGSVAFSWWETGWSGAVLGAIIISILTTGFITWIWFATYYILDKEFMHYKSGPIFGKIPIHKIRKIKKNTTMYAGLKPALATKGLIVSYEKYNDIYISPENVDSFINELMLQNPAIIVE